MLTARGRADSASEPWERAAPSRRGPTVGTVTG